MNDDVNVIDLTRASSRQQGESLRVRTRDAAGEIHEGFVDIQVWVSAVQRLSTSIDERFYSWITDNDAAALNSLGLDADRAAELAELATRARDLLVHTSSPVLAQRDEALIEAMLPRHHVPTASAVLQLRRNAELRAWFMKTHGALTAAEVAEIADSDARNRSALASRWRTGGRIFAVRYHGTEFYPVLQFDEAGKPRAVISQLISLAPEMVGWQLALWLASPSNAFGGSAPLSKLSVAPDSVIAALGRVVDPDVW